VKALLAKVRKAWAFLLTKLNAVGSILLAYALLNPTAASELIALLPEKLKTPVALGVPALWFMLVQYAKAKAIKKAEAQKAG
jgi:hypothetical protein